MQFLYTSAIVALVSSVAAEAADSAGGRPASPGVLGLPVVDPVYLKAFEGVLIIMAAAFVVNWYQGFQENSRIGDRVAIVLNSLLEPQFARLGIDTKGTSLLKDGPGEFLHYATGRRYCAGLTTSMQLRHRQDLFAVVLNFFQPSVSDRCTMTIPLLNDFPMEPISMFLVKPKELDRLRHGGLRSSAAVKTVEELAGEVRLQSKDEGGFYIIADHAEVLKTVLPDRLMSQILPIASGVHSIQITDCGAPWDEYSAAAGKRYVRLVFDLPTGSTEEMREMLTTLVNVSMSLVDLAAKAKLPAAARAKAVELRRRLAAEEQRILMKRRKEEAGARKLEQKRKEEEEVDRKLRGSAQKQAKYNEKKRKQEMKSRMKKATKAN